MITFVNCIFVYHQSYFIKFIFGKMKYFILPFFSMILFSGCTCNNNKVKIVQISGEAQGTTYHISLLANDKTDHKPAIDSILQKIDLSLSTYLPSSIVSRINNNDSNVMLDDHFIKVFTKSQEVGERTSGAFDITVAPVINAWGFGFSKKEEVDSARIKNLLQFIGYKRVYIQNNKVVKEDPGIKLDFNAIAQGYAVDVLAAYLDSKEIVDYFVELGGEVKAKGDKGDHEFWKIGIDKPEEGPVEQREIQAVVKLYNQALATSGNYRRFYEENGQKFSHIIDPKTGYPAKNNLLSVSVIADDCMTADAYATAFMVMGLKKSLQFLAENRALHLGVFLIFDEMGTMKTYTSESLNKWVEILD